MCDKITEEAAPKKYNGENFGGAADDKEEKEKSAGAGEAVCCLRLLCEGMSQKCHICL